MWEYLSQERGLTSETIQTQKIGYATGKGLLSYLYEQNCTLEQAIEAGVVYDATHEYFAGHIVFPHWVNGRVVYLSARDWPEKSHKKLPRKRVSVNHLYLEDTLQGKEVILAEGKTDTLTLRQAGFNACGILGVTGFKLEWVERFNQVETAYLAFDGDGPGKQASVKLAKLFGEKAKVVQFPEASGNGSGIKDWNELFVKACKGNVEAFRKSHGSKEYDTSA